MLRASWFVIAIAVTQLVYSVVLCIKSSVRNIIVSTGIMFLLGYVLVVVYRDLPEWFVENHWLHSKELPNRLPACVNLAFVQSPFFALGILYRHFECRIPKYLIEDMKYLIMSLLLYIVMYIYIDHSYIGSSMCVVMNQYNNTRTTEPVSGTLTGTVG